MPGPNSAPNGAAELVRGYPRELFVCVRKQHNCGDSECKMVSKRTLGYPTGKTEKKNGH